MEYIDVICLHNEPARPVRYVAELDAERHEIRKVEFFQDGRIATLSRDDAQADDSLGKAAPRVDEINTNFEFDARLIDQAEFDRLWAQHI